jgi:Ca2+-binding EF-hand superfamily protein
MTEVITRSRSSSHPDVQDVVRNTSKEELTLLKQTFNLFDQDGDGSIAPSELVHVMRSLNMDISESEAKTLVAEVDSGKGVISFEGFVFLMKTPTAKDSGKRRGSSSPTTSSPRFGNSLFGALGFNQTKTSTSSPSSRRNSVSTSPSKSRPTTTTTTARKSPVSNRFGLIGLFGKNNNKAKAGATEKIHVGPADDVEEEMSQDDELRDVFKVFDINGDGCLSVGEMKNIMNKLGLGVVMKEEEVRQLFSLVDSNGDGLITENEFIELFSMC